MIDPNLINDIDEALEIANKLASRNYSVTENDDDVLLRDVLERCRAALTPGEGEAKPWKRPSDSLPALTIHGENENGCDIIESEDLVIVMYEQVFCASYGAFPGQEESAVWYVNEKEVHPNMVEWWAYQKDVLPPRAALNEPEVQDEH